MFLLTANTLCVPVFALDDELTERLNSEKKYVTFVAACLNGKDCTHVVQFDDDDILMLLGKTASVAAKLPVLDKGKLVCPVTSEERQKVSDRRDVVKADNDEQFQTRENIPLGREITVEKELPTFVSGSDNDGLTTIVFLAVGAFCLLNFVG